MNKVTPLKSSQSGAFCLAMINLLLHEGLYNFDQEQMVIGKMLHEVLHELIPDSSDGECGVMNLICTMYNKLVMWEHLGDLSEKYVPSLFFQKLEEIGRIVVSTRSASGRQAIAGSSALITWKYDHRLAASQKSMFMQLTIKGELLRFLLLLVTFTISLACSHLPDLSFLVGYWSRDEARACLAELGGGNAPASLVQFMSSPAPPGGMDQAGYLRIQLVNAVNKPANMDSRHAVGKMLAMLDLALCKACGMMPHRGCFGGAEELIEFWMPAALSASPGELESPHEGVLSDRSQQEISTVFSSALSETSIGLVDVVGISERPTGIGAFSQLPLRVLLMEDSVLVQKILQRLLNQHGCTVTIAKNGRVGLEMLQSNPFDVAIIDFVMPIVDGVTTMRLFKMWIEQQRKNSSYSPGTLCNEEIILVGHSDAATDYDKSTARYNDMHIFCEKPMKPEILDIILSARRTYSDFAKVLEVISTKSVKLYREETSIMNMISSKFRLGGLGKKTVQQQSAIRKRRGSRSSSKSTSPARIQQTTSSSSSPTSSLSSSPSTSSIWGKMSSILPGKGKETKALDIERSAPDSNSIRIKSAPASAESNSMKVLVIDDSVPVQLAFYRLMSTYGCDVKVGRHSHQFVDLLRIEYFDIVFIDLAPGEKDPSIIEIFNTLCKYTTHPSTESSGSVPDDSSCDDNGTVSSLASENTRDHSCLVVGMSDIGVEVNTDCFFRNGMHLYCGKPIDATVLHELVISLREHSTLSETMASVASKLTSKILLPGCVMLRPTS